MVFKKIWNWIDEYFSKDENEQIIKQKQIIEDLSNRIKEYEERINQLVAINKKISENNKQLIAENAELKKEIENNNTKSKYYDLICKVVEDNILKEVIEVSNQK